MAKGSFKGIFGLAFLIAGAYLFWGGIFALLGMTLGAWFVSVMPSPVYSIWLTAKGLITILGTSTAIAGAGMYLVGLKWVLQNETAVIKLGMLGVGIFFVVLGAIVFIAGGWIPVMAGIIIFGMAAAFIQRGSGLNVIPWINKMINSTKPLLEVIPIK